jgi:uncharacterized membrane protein YfcA
MVDYHKNNKTRMTLLPISLLKKRILTLCVLLLCLFGLLVQQTSPWQLVTDYVAFMLVGGVGAIFANATGAGGGVVFVPLFNQFGLTPMNIVATSFAIQCFGMVAGAISWRDQYVKSQKNGHLQSIWASLPAVLLYTIPTSIAGIWTVQYSGLINLINGSDDMLHWVFGSFSICLALALFITIPKMKRAEQAFALTSVDKWALPVIAYLGGMITAWLSVGVGELVAVYLILRNAAVTLSIGCAVILTAFSVWSGVGYFVLHDFVLQDAVNISLSLDEYSAIVYPIAAFAGLGAIIGGTIAKHLVLLFNPVQVKLFFATWVLIMGVASLPFAVFVR